MTKIVINNNKMIKFLKLIQDMPLLCNYNIKFNYFIFLFKFFILLNIHI